MPEVVDKVLDKQFKDYLESQNISNEAINEEAMKKYQEAYAQAMYPGSNLPPEKIISQLISQNPEVTLSSEVLVEKGYDECESTSGDIKRSSGGQSPSCPSSSGEQWDDFQIDKDGRRRILCLNEDVNSGQMTTGISSFLQPLTCELNPNLPQCCKTCGSQLVGNTCTRHGANRLGFSLDDSVLQEKLFELYCDWKNRHGPQQNSNCK